MHVNSVRAVWVDRSGINVSLKNPGDFGLTLAMEANVLVPDVGCTFGKTNTA